MNVTGRRARPRLAVLTTVAMVFGGCEGGRAGLVRVGLADPAPPPPETIDVLCDPSVGSTCTVEKLGHTLAVFGRAAARHGSVVRLWLLGATVEATKVQAEVTSLVPTGKTARARAKEAARWQAHQREVFLASVAPIIAAPRPPTSSPLVEAITRIALTDGHGLPRKIALVSDGREMGIADFECGPLPSDASWAARLKKLRLLAPGTLVGVEVSFTYLTLPPIKRCSVSLKREQRIRELWKSALTAAGASEVRMLSGPIAWDERDAARAEEETE